MSRYRICVIDDEASQAEELSAYLNESGYHARSFSSASACIKHLEKDYADCVITDLKMPEMSGLELLQRTKSLNPDISVILITAFGTVEDAVQAMREGASDFLSKPVDLDELQLRLEKLFEHRLLQSENRILKEQLRDRNASASIIYDAPAMDEVLNLVSRVSDSMASVLIRGESGTGKEMIALAIHQASSRAAKPFTAVNCAAIPEALFESEFFGHEKGAFTGAHERKHGRLESAAGGTLFLDEVADIPLNFQVKLLRVLQNGDYQRLGSSQTLQADVRILSATNKNMDELISEGSFRADLFYRLNVVPLTIPPLRERKADIPLLCRHFIQKHAERNRRAVRDISPEALNKLMHYGFPGNVRELENIIERAVILTRSEVLQPRDIPDLQSTAAGSEHTGGTLSDQVEALELRLIRNALQLHEGTQTRAAESLGLTERNLRYKMQKYGLEKESFR